MQQSGGRLPIMKTRLKELQGDMSATDFAKKIGLSRQTVGFYLNGDRIPDSETLIQICQSCNVSADWLLGLSTEKTLDSSAQSASRYTGLSGEAVEFLHNCPNVSTRSFYRKFFDDLLQDGLLEDVPKLIFDAAQARVIANKAGTSEDLQRDLENKVATLSDGSSSYVLSATVAEQFFLRQAQDEIHQAIELTVGSLQCEVIEALKSGASIQSGEFQWIVADESEPKQS